MGLSEALQKLDSYKKKDDKATSTPEKQDISSPKPPRNTGSGFDSAMSKLEAYRSQSNQKQEQQPQVDTGSVQEAIDSIEIPKKEKGGFFNTYKSIASGFDKALDATVGEGIRATSKLVLDDTFIKSYKQIKEGGFYNLNEIKEASDMQKKGILNVGQSAWDFFSKSLPKSVATLGNLVTENAPMALVNPAGTIIYGKEKIEERREKASKFFEDAIEGLEKQQRESIESQGVTSEMSIFNPEKFGSALGSGGASLALAVATGGLTKSTAVAGAVLGWIEGSDTYNEAKEQLREQNPDWSEDKVEQRSAMTALTDAAGIAVLEKVGLDFLFRYGGTSMYNRAVNAITETAQENTQTIWSALVGKYGYDKETDLVQELIEVSVVTPFLGILGGGGANLVSDVQVVDDVADKMNMEKEDAQQLLETTMPLVDEFVETEVKSGKVFEEEKQRRDALVEDVKDSVKTNGEQETIEEVQAEFGVDKKEAKSFVDDVLAEFTGEQDELMKNLDEAEKVVRAEQQARNQEGQVVEEKATEKEEQVPDVVAEIPQSKQEEAEIDWENNYSEKYGELAQQSVELSNQLKTARKSEKQALQKQIEEITQEQVQLEEEFTGKYQKAFKEEVDSAVNEVADSVSKKAPETYSPTGGRLTKERIKEEEADGAEVFSINVNGVDYDVSYNPDKFGTKHFQFYGPLEGPVSNTGYRSEFLSPGEDLQGYTPQEFAQKMAEARAKAETEERTKRERAEKRDKKKLDKKKKEAENKTNDKTNKDNDSGGDVRGGKNTERSESGNSEQGGGRESDTVDSTSVARGSGETSSSRSGERSSTRVSPEIQALEQQMRDVYISAGALEETEGYTKADEELGNILVQLELAKPGGRIFSEDDNGGTKVTGYPSTFPSWIPEKSRTSKDVAKALETLTEVRELSYPATKTAVNQREFADALFEQLDYALDVDTSEIRSNILELYGDKEKQAETPSVEGEESAEEIADQIEVLWEEVEEEREALDVKQGDIEAVIDTLTTVDDNGVVQLKREATERELDIIDTYRPAGGREAEGAEGAGLLDEYYTPTEVTRMVQDTLYDLGAFKYGGFVLEPSAGIGNFLHSVPAGINTEAYEINDLTARITKIHHSYANVLNKPFEEIFVDNRGNKKNPEPVYDVVLGNPPYGKHRGKYKGLGEEAKIEKYETYFIKRSLDLTKEGGYVAMVVPSGFVRSSSSQAGKTAIAERGELVEAYRLPNGAFDTTDIGTDILVFKKNTSSDLATITSRKTTMSDDMYFRSVMNLDRVLGTSTMKKGRFGEEEVIEGTLADAFEKFKGMTNVEYAEQITENEEIQEGIEEELEESYNEKAYKEVREETDFKEEVNKIDVSDLGTTVIKQKKRKKKGVLNLATLSTKVSEEDAEMWSMVKATGELKGVFDRNKAFFFKGEYYNKFNYAQGDIYEKLDELEKDREEIGEENYKRQKAVLEEVLPEQVTVDRISVPPNARFVKEYMIKSGDENKEDIPLSEAFMKWLRTLPNSALGDSSTWAIRGYVNNTPVRGGDKLQNEKERRTRRKEGDRLFKLYIQDELQGEEQDRFIEQYNRQLNSYARPNYRDVPLVGEVSDTFHGDKLDIKEVQLQGVGFLVNRGVGLLAHDVGVGKTMQAILATGEMLQRGWTKRPLIVVPNISVYNQWISEIQDLLPNVEINELANLGGDFKGDIDKLDIKEGTISMITEEGFKRLGFEDKTYNGLTADFFDTIENPNKKKTKRQLELEKAQASEAVGKGIRGTRGDISFEKLGFDYIAIDEAHNANHIIARAKMDEGEVSEFRGFNIRPSLYGIKTWLATQYILKNNQNRNVVLLSATPFTNNPLEYYSILSLMARERMQRMGIRNVNDFMTMFMDIQTQHEFKADGSYVEKNEVRSFKNYQQFQKLLTEFIDFRDGEEAGVVRPKRHSREYTVAETEEQFNYKILAQELFKDTKNAGTLKAIGEMRAVAFSPYLSRENTETPSVKEFVENSPKIKLTLNLIKQTLKDNPSGGHLIYSTIGVEYFPLIKQYMVKEMGLKDSEVDIISGSTPKKKRAGIQKRFNEGKVKVILGSDAIQEGVNLQRNTTDLYILSLPWNFTALRQVIGRAWRQGNRWKNLRVNNIFTENSVDVFMSQKLQNKEKRYEESLKFKGDELDVGDINFEELKFDLITDPVERAVLEYQLKENELETEIKRTISEAGYENRRASEYLEVSTRVRQYEQYKKEDPDNDWYKSSLESAKKNLETVTATLVDKGFNVEEIQAQVAKTEKKVETLKNQLEDLKKEKAKALEKAEQERGETFAVVGETDYAQFIAERKEDNNTFFEDGPLFQRIETKDDPAFWETLTSEERQVYLDGVGGKELTDAERKIFKSATTKYLDFVDNGGAPVYFLREGVTTSILEQLKGKTVVARQFIEDALKQQAVKKAEKEVINQTLAEVADEKINVDIFREKVVSRLLPVEAKSLVQESEEGDELAVRYDSVNLPEELRPNVEIAYDEIIYTSPIENNAGAVHFRHAPQEIRNKYFAHVRREDIALEETFLPEDPKERRILEIQSDLYQKGRLASQYEPLSALEEAVLAGKEKIPQRFLPVNIINPSEPVDVTAELNLEDMGEERLQAIRATANSKIAINKEISRLSPYKNTWHELIIRNEIKSAAKDNVKELYFPTGETAYAIEGLGAAADGGMMFAVDSIPLEAGDIVVGKEIYSESQDETWFITEDLGGSKFKAVSEFNLEELSKERGYNVNLKAYLEFANKETRRRLEEEFSISGEIDKENPIYKYYEDTVRKYLNKIRTDLERVEDEKGVTWYKTKITPEDVEKPVSAFQRDSFEAFEFQATTREEAVQVLEDYKERFKVDFNVPFVDAILTGEVDAQGKPVRARAVTYNNNITLTENLTKTTADHEFVHLVLLNLGKIEAFEEFTTDELYKAVNGGKDYTVQDIERLQEKLAVGFEQFVADRKTRQETLLGKFYQVLLDLLTDFYRAFTVDVDVVAEFYNILARGESIGDEGVVLETNKSDDLLIQTRTKAGDLVADFGLMEKLTARREEQTAFFERLRNNLSDIPEGNNINLMRKDINFLEDVIVQARDLVLKDPNEFSAAKTFEKIADSRRMKKSALDEKVSELLKPYMTLDKTSKEKVTKALMQGDKDAVEYTDRELIEGFDLNKKQIEAYNYVRFAFNTAHEMLITQMEQQGLAEEEVEEFKQTRKGYMPHKWKYRFAVKKQVKQEDGSWLTTEMSTYKNKSKAAKAFDEAIATNGSPRMVRYAIDTLDSLEVDFFTQQSLSFEAMKTVMTQAKTSEEVKAQMTEALRNMIKEKGFGRQYIKRSGVEGYDEKEAPRHIADYFAGLNGFLTKMEAGKKYYDTLATVDARRQKKFYNWLRDAIAYDMANTQEWRMVRTVAFIWFLANDISFLAVNATQNYIVGTGELSKYMTKSQKLLFKPERLISKAQADWALGRIKEDEKAVINGLLKLGELGGEMAAELTGFKNNPIYREISSTANKLLFNSTAIVETHFNRIPAFLAARRLFIKQGMEAKDANEKALEVSNDIHFRYGKQNRPRFMRGVIGNIFTFQNYIRSFLYQLYRDVGNREYMALTRKMGYTGLLGGTLGLPFAGLFITISRMIFGANDDDEEEKEASKLKILIERGLPAVYGIDLSGRVGIDVISVNSIIQEPNKVTSWIGVVGGLGERLYKGAKLLSQGRLTESAGKLFPDFVGNPFEAYEGYRYGVKSFAGTPLENMDGSIYRYNTMEAIVKALGFTPTQEAILWDEKSKQWAEMDRVSRERTQVRRTIQNLMEKGEVEQARQLQEEGRRDGIITDNIDYIRDFGRQQFMETALTVYNNNPESLKSIESKLVEELYGPDATDSQKNNTRKDFAVVRAFGMNNPFAENLSRGVSNDEKVEYLLEARRDMAEGEFSELFKAGRKEIRLESGNKSHILISDDVEEKFRKRKNDPEFSEGETPVYNDDSESTETGIIKTVLKYAEAIKVDPITAFNRIFTGQKIRRIDNDTIIVERMSLDDSSSVRRERGAEPDMRLDHTVPLVLGGSNSEKNLKLVPVEEWATYTPIETYLGRKLRDNEISKKEAQTLITKFKNKEITADEVYNYN